MVGGAAAAQPLPSEFGGVSIFAPRFQSREPLASAGHLPLAPRAIHLWAVDVGLALQSDPSQTRTGMALLTTTDRAGARRLRNPAQRALYLGGKIGLRRLLCAYTGIANHDLRFGYGIKGKPALLNTLPGGKLCFNYSLSGNKALYALAWNRQVGIDLETWPRKINAAGLARRTLAAVERQTWDALPPPSREQAMLACWTRKEAYGKALGVGIRYNFNQAPMFVGLDSPVWQCEVRGLFDAAPVDDTPTLHGVQLAPPFPGIAALVYDGEALELADGEALQAWQWHRQIHPTNAGKSP